MKHNKNNLVKFKVKQHIKLSRGEIFVANVIIPANGESLGSYLSLYVEQTLLCISTSFQVLRAPESWLKPYINPLHSLYYSSCILHS